MGVFPTKVTTLDFGDAIYLVEDSSFLVIGISVKIFELKLFEADLVEIDSLIEENLDSRLIGVMVPKELCIGDLRSPGDRIEESSSFLIGDAGTESFDSVPRNEDGLTSACVEFTSLSFILAGDPVNCPSCLLNSAFCDDRSDICCVSIATCCKTAEYSVEV
jgi:hypothetical protein